MGGDVGGNGKHPDTSGESRDATHAVPGGGVVGDRVRFSKMKSDGKRRQQKSSGAQGSTAKKNSKRVGGIVGLGMRRKVTVRRLPSCFVKSEQFLDQLERLVAEKKGVPAYEFLYLLPGNISEREEEQYPACAVLLFDNDSDALSFAKAVDGHCFEAIPLSVEKDANQKPSENEATMSDTGNESVPEKISSPIEMVEKIPCLCEVSINRRIPSPEPSAQSNTIKDNREFLGFVSMLANGELAPKQKRVEASENVTQPSALLQFMLDRSNKIKKRNAKKSSRQAQRGQQQQQQQGNAQGAQKVEKANKNRNNSSRRNNSSKNSNKKSKSSPSAGTGAARNAKKRGRGKPKASVKA